MNAFGKLASRFTCNRENSGYKAAMGDFPIGDLWHILSSRGRPGDRGDLFVTTEITTSLCPLRGFAPRNDGDSNAVGYGFIATMRLFGQSYGGSRKQLFLDPTACSSYKAS